MLSRQVKVRGGEGEAGVCVPGGEAFTENDHRWGRLKWREIYLGLTVFCAGVVRNFYRPREICRGFYFNVI